MTPRLDITVRRRPETDEARLVLTFEGPPELERLDTVEIEIRNDGYPYRNSSYAQRVPSRGWSREEILNTIWGPYRFSRVSAHGREVQAEHVELGECLHFSMERSAVPPWFSSDSTFWRDHYSDAPVRLWVRCRREGHRVWILAYDVDVVEADDS